MRIRALYVSVARPTHPPVGTLIDGGSLEFVRALSVGGGEDAVFTLASPQHFQHMELPCFVPACDSWLVSSPFTQSPMTHLLPVSSKRRNAVGHPERQSAKPACPQNFLVVPSFTPILFLMAFRSHLVLPALPFPLSAILDPTHTPLKWFPQSSTTPLVIPITLIPNIPWAFHIGVSLLTIPSFLLTHCQKSLFYLAIRLSKYQRNPV
jgi:hypothetical protein